MLYKVDFSYMEPRWGEIEEYLDAETVEEAKEEARKWIETTYPEALDIEIEVKIVE